MYFVKVNSKDEAVALFDVSETGYYGQYFDKTTFEWTYKEGIGSDVRWDTETFHVSKDEALAIIESFKADAPYVAWRRNP